MECHGPQRHLAVQHCALMGGCAARHSCTYMGPASLRCVRRRQVLCGTPALLPVSLSRLSPSCSRRTKAAPGSLSSRPKRLCTTVCTPVHGYCTAILMRRNASLVEAVLRCSGQEIEISDPKLPQHAEVLPERLCVASFTQLHRSRQRIVALVAGLSSDWHPCRRKQHMRTWVEVR